MAIFVTMVKSNKSCCKHILFMNFSDFISTTTRVTSVKYKKFLLGSFSVAKFGIAPFVFPFVSDNFVFIYSNCLCQNLCFSIDWWFCVVLISSPHDWIHLSVDGVGVLCEASRTRLLSCWESRKVNPLLYPHSSHLTHTLSFLLSFFLFIHLSRSRSSQEIMPLASS